MRRQQLLHDFRNFAALRQQYRQNQPSRDTKPWNHLILKARKYLDISPSSIPLLTSSSFRELNSSAIKLLLSKYLKKNPFQNISFRPKSQKIIIAANNAKKYTALEQESDLFALVMLSSEEKSQLPLFKKISSSYKSLESLDLSLIQIKKAFLTPLKKLNQLRKLRLNLPIENAYIYLNFFKGFNKLKHVTLQISDTSNGQHDLHLARLASVLYEFTLLPALESYSIEASASSKSDHEKEAFLGTLLYYLSLSKAKRFSVKIHCSGLHDLKLDIFRSWIESIDTLELKLKTKDQPEVLQLNPLIDSQRKLTFILDGKPSAAETFINLCPSLENVHIDLKCDSPHPVSLKFPPALKALTLRIDNSIWEKTSELFKTWQSAISNLESLQEFHLEVLEPDGPLLNFVSNLFQLKNFQNLKKYSLQIQGYVSLIQPDTAEYGFLEKWSQGLQYLRQLESLTLSLIQVHLDSLGFFAQALSNCSNLKDLNIYFNLPRSGLKEKSEFATPWQYVPKLENLWLEFVKFDSKSFTHDILKDIPHLENLKSLNIIGLDFDENVKISTLSKLKNLKQQSIIGKKKKID